MVPMGIPKRSAMSVWERPSKVRESQCLALDFRELGHRLGDSCRVIGGDSEVGSVGRLVGRPDVLVRVDGAGRASTCEIEARFRAIVNSHVVTCARSSSYEPAFCQTATKTSCVHSSARYLSPSKR